MKTTKEKFHHLYIYYWVENMITKHNLYCERRGVFAINGEINGIKWSNSSGSKIQLITTTNM